MLLVLTPIRPQKCTVWVAHLFCIQGVLNTDISWLTKHPDFIVVFLGPIKQMPRPYQTLRHNCSSKPFPIHYSLIPPLDNILSWVTNIMTEHHLKIVPVHAMKAYRGSTDITPLNFNLGTRWTWVTTFMPQPFYPWKTASVPTEYRARWLSESVWTVLENRKSLIVCFPLGKSPASEFYMPTFHNTLFHLHRHVGMKND